MQKPKPHFTTPTGGGGVRFLERRETPPQPPFVPPGHVAFRLLCHASRVGGVIGKSGSIVKQLQHETSAKIRIEDSLPSPDDRRVIFIIASAVVDKKIKLSASKRATFSEEEEEGGNSHDEEVIEVEVSLAQEATVRVFERVIEVAAETDGLGTVAGGLTSCRLLAAPNQVGSVIGKGGSVIDKIRNDTGCRIKALKVDKIWHSPSFTDEVIEIEGDLLGVKRAIVAVTHCLQDCPPNVGRTWVSSSRQFEAVPLQNAYDLPDELPSRRAPFVRSAAAAPSGFALNRHRFSVGDERISTTASRMPQQEVAFKILCPNDRVGSIIGPGGSIVKSIQADTGASIKVDPPVATCDVRGVTISAMENPNLRQSVAQNATMIVFRRFVDACHEIDSVSGLVGSQISVALVVPSNQVGCLLGKGGAIVSEMRKTTATAIQIHTSDQVRPCILENEEVVQITGKFANVQDALYKVMTRLRDNLVATKLFSPNTDKSPYGRTNEPFQLGFSLPAGVSHQLTHRMDNLRLSQSEHRPQFTRPWTSQAQNGVNGKTDGGWTSPKNGVELGRSVIVTNTTIEIAVPEEVVESVCGENGSNLDRLRQISGAKVVMHEPEAGKAERTIVLSGSREETLAAQSLLQAFII